MMAKTNYSFEKRQKEIAKKKKKEEKRIRKTGPLVQPIEDIKSSAGDDTVDLSTQDKS